MTFPAPTPLLLGLLTGLLALSGCATSTQSDAPSPPMEKAPIEEAQVPELPIERINDELYVRQIQEKSWVVTHEVPYAANSLLVQADNGSLLLVDTPYTPEATKALLEWMDRKFGPGQRGAVNTHFHLDALGGNPALRDARVAARGHLRTRELLAERGRERVNDLLEALEDRPEEKAKFEDVELLQPSTLFAGGGFTLPLGTGAEEYSMIYPGPAHSPDNLVVYIPQRKLLFGGCMIKGGKNLGFLGDADLERWPTAVRRLMDLEVEIVVPGHGPRLDPGLLQHTLDLLERQR